MQILKSSILVGAAVASASCDRLGRDYLTAPNPDWPGVVHLGELPVLGSAEFQAEADRIENITYARLGAPLRASMGEPQPPSPPPVEVSA